mmetsp:Transcript_8037/g.11538  ORF Transcript_8037/g.11538 Transcript_8037/m.11538 type:complete len:117 (-) Transcript_8037:324-674(-)
MSNVSEELFLKAAGIVGDKDIKPQKSSGIGEKVRLYGLYKRGTIGKLSPPYDAEDTDTDKRPTSRPGLLKFDARQKYDGWAACDSMSKQEARDAYVKLAEELVGKPVTDAIEAATK